MINKRYYFAMVAMFCVSNIALAGTIIELQDEDGLSTVLTDGKFARINVSADEYIIIDYKTNTVKVVSPKQRQVMLLDNNQISAAPVVAAVRTSIKSLGAGVNIAGYATQKFSYTANGKSCGVIYGSKEAYQKPGVKKLFNAIGIMMEKQQALLGGFAGMVDDCTLADMQVSEHVKLTGVPMRMVKNGRVDSEIKSIKYGVTLPKDTFVIPQSYRVVSMDTQMNSVNENVSDMQQTMQQPQVQQMMQQMQQSGQMTPEMMEQMRKAEQLMKQYQQR